MRGRVLASLILGFLVIAVGGLALLQEAGVLFLEWRLVGPVVVIAFGLWILLCSFECYGPFRRSENN